MGLQNIDSRWFTCKILQIKELAVNGEGPRFSRGPFVSLLPLYRLEHN
jgi:hypothetical protein